MKVAVWVTILVVPAFVVSQWLAIKWDLPTRTAFNAAMVVAGLVVVGLRFRSLAEYRVEVGFAAGVVFAVILSSAINGVDFSVAVRGALPYVAVPMIALAGLAGAIPAEGLRRGAWATAVTMFVLAATALIEHTFGRAGHVALGQDLTYPRWWERGRATGLVANPGRLSQLGVLGVGVSPVLGYTGAGIALAAAAGFVVAAGVSRTALLAIAAVSVAALFARRWAPEAGRLIFVSVAVAVVATAAIAIANPAARDDLLGRTAAIAEPGEGSVPGDVRIANYRATVRVISDHPVVGVGPGRFGSTTAFRTGSNLHAKYGLPDVRSAEFASDLESAKAEQEIDIGIAQLEFGWGQIAAEIGFLGLVTIAGLTTSLVVRAWRRRRFVPIALLTGLTVFSITAPGIADASLVAAVLWWATVALSSPDERRPGQPVS